MEFDLKQSLQEHNSARIHNQKLLSDHTTEFILLENLHISQENDIAELERKLQIAQNSRNESNLTNLNPKLKAFSLTITVLENHFEQQKTGADFLTEEGKRLDNVTDEIKAKRLYLEEQFLKKDFKKNFQEKKEQLSKISCLRKRLEELENIKIRDLDLKTCERQHEIEKELYELKNKQLQVLDQIIQESKQLREELAERTEGSTKLSGELEALSAKTVELNCCSQGKRDTLNPLKQSFNDWSKEFEANLQELDEKVEKDEAECIKSEETVKTSKREIDTLIEKDKAAQHEETDFEEQLAEEEGIVTNLNEQNSDGDSLKSILTKKTKVLECDDLSLKNKKNSLLNGLSDLEEETKFVNEKIIQEDSSVKEQLINLEACTDAESFKIAKLESDYKEADDNEIKLNEEREISKAIKADNTQFIQKYALLTAKEKDFETNFMSAKQEFEALNKDVIAVNEERRKENNKLIDSAIRKENHLESLENQCLLLEQVNGKLSKRLSDLLYDELREGECLDSEVSNNQSESDQKIEINKKTISETKSKIDGHKENSIVLYNKFNGEYKKKGSEERSLRVESANLMEKVDKVQKVEANLHELLLKSLKTDRELAQISSRRIEAQSRKLSFSENLEKFSPQTFVGVEQPLKSILKRKKGENRQESPKRPRTNSESTMAENYFPNFSNL